ncbi:MAG: ParB/RepB/Spo0J family partition protein [Phycisphaerales bacterium]
MVAKKPVSRLGKGIAGLVNIDAPPESRPHDDAERLANIPLADIAPNPYQPRQRLDEQRLQELAESIRAHGVMQPITVRPRPDNDLPYELVAGERRWRAAQRLGLETIPARIISIDDRTSAELALVENVQRADLDPIERGQALVRLRDEFQQTVVDLAKRIGQPRSTIANLMRLTELEDEIAQMLRDGALTLGHAKVLLGVPSGQKRLDLAHRAVGGDWTVRQLEIAGKDALQTPNSSSSSASAPSSHQLSPSEQRRRAQLQQISNDLSDQLSTRVLVTQERPRGAGTIQIHFFDDAHFETLLRQIHLKLKDL